MNEPVDAYVDRYNSILGRIGWWRRLFGWQWCNRHGWVPKYLWEGCCQYYQ